MRGRGSASCRRGRTREAGARLDRGLEDAGLELRNAGHDFAVGADHGGDAVARRAHQEATGFERAEARHLQLLVRRRESPNQALFVTLTSSVAPGSAASWSAPYASS